MDKEKLFQDVKFPLHWGCEEYKMYIFDADDEMVAMTYYDVLDATATYHPFEKLIGEYKDVEEPPNAKYAHTKGDYYDKGISDEPIGCVRGWGHISNKYRKNITEAENRQDNIGEYIFLVINS